MLPPASQSRSLRPRRSLDGCTSVRDELIRANHSDRGFTLVELLVSMSLGMMVMAAVFSTYLYLGRNLTRLSFRSVLESQSRKILTVLAADIRNTTSITNPSPSHLTLNTSCVDPVTKAVTQATISYDFNAGKLTRDPDDIGMNPPVVLNYDIGGVPVSMPDFNFYYFTTTGATPTYQGTTTLVPMSVKQVAVTFTLQAGTAAIQGQQGTLTSYPVASARMPLISRTFPDGS